LKSPSPPVIIDDEASGVDTPLRELSLAGYDDDDDDDDDVDVETPAAFTIVIKDGPMGVDLRELHQELGSKRDFSSWTKKKLKQFVEDEDFVILTNSGVNSGRGRPTIDYTVTVDTAKNIALMEKTERGKEVLHYLIECENTLMSGEPLTRDEVPTAETVNVIPLNLLRPW